jgi:hypothetical protein
MKRVVPTLLLMPALLMPPLHGSAHEGAPHAEQAPATGPADHLPRRLPDGAVALPKPVQRTLSLRTVVAERRPVPAVVLLTGRVVTDPQADGHVQASWPGRLEPGPHGLPLPGQAVRAGQVLARVVANVDPLARAQQVAQQAELRAARTLAEQRLQRLQSLADTVPRKDIDAARNELGSLDARLAALAPAAAPTELLRAPVSGVIARSEAVAGQVVEARDLLFEIVDPRRLLIEAIAFDAGLAADVVGAELQSGDRRWPLAFVGAGRVMKEQALPLLFRVRQRDGLPLALGQPVTVAVQRRTPLEGLPLPAAALVRSAANEAQVWVKTAPERFEPRRVQHLPLDGGRVLVTSGVQAGERVVAEGAAMLPQVR